MEEVRNQLSAQERAFLSELWENKDLLRSLQSALSHRQLWLAQFTLASATDFNQVMKSRGQVDESNWFIKFLKFNYQQTKAEKAKAAQK